MKRLPPEELIDTSDVERLKQILIGIYLKTIRDIGYRFEPGV
jgi:hypothetical protein